MYFDFIFIFLLEAIFISWRLITLQYYSGFCHTLTCTLEATVIEIMQIINTKKVKISKILDNHFNLNVNMTYF